MKKLKVLLPILVIVIVGFSLVYIIQVLRTQNVAPEESEALEKQQPSYPVEAVCGNDICEEGEYVPCPAGAQCIWIGSCPEDCWDKTDYLKAECDNSICEEGEADYWDCPECEEGSRICSTRACIFKPGTCPQDCGECGNGICDPGEDDIYDCPECKEEDRYCQMRYCSIIPGSCTEDCTFYKKAALEEADIDESGNITIRDWAIFAAFYERKCTETSNQALCEKVDVNDDGVVDRLDLTFLLMQYTS